MWIAKSLLLVGGLTVALASCANTSTKISGDSLIEFDHGSRTFQEPRGRWQTNTPLPVLQTETRENCNPRLKSERRSRGPSGPSDYVGQASRRYRRTAAER